MRKICFAVVVVLVVAYLIALAILLIGTLGLFGSERDPLSGAYLLLLGLPWIVWLDALPEPMLPWVGALAPAANLVVLGLLCSIVRGRRKV